MTTAAAAAAAWNRGEEKAFENAIALHWIGDESEEQWRTISSMVPSKSVEDVMNHYQLLMEDVRAIESGLVPVPSYAGDEATSCSSKDFHGGFCDKRPSSGFGSGFSTIEHDRKGGSKSDQERRKGIPWTEEEHRLFLLGLEKYGKGDWRSISRNYVLSRTPTQVASHAQKYFIRLNSINRDRRRTSIHDITGINNGGDASSAPITGQQITTNSSNNCVAAMGQSARNHSQPHLSGLGMYGAPIGHPVSVPGHMTSAVGTPVMLPPGHHPHPPYVLPVAYPMAPPTMHH